jgi:hypothetical protein
VGKDIDGILHVALTREFESPLEAAQGKIYSGTLYTGSLQDGELVTSTLICAHYRLGATKPDITPPPHNQRLKLQARRRRSGPVDGKSGETRSGEIGYVHLFANGRYSRWWEPLRCIAGGASEFRSFRSGSCSSSCQPYKHFIVAPPSARRSCDIHLRLSL